MSLKQITLRPPPNVDFVHGYPGIPPVNNRPPAEVMGSVELRFPNNGLKAKWVKVVLRKIECLPGGLPASPTPDFIGQMPQTIWSAQGEHEIIITKELPFRLRLPESIPPSIVLEKGAGIKYELVASVCVKGKKGLLRKSSSSVIEDLQLLQIDKHELHSTWPVYNQLDTRTDSRDQLSLTVSRTQSCYSPGERVQVKATLHSNSYSAAHLRAFDFSLVETIQFRPAPKVKPIKKAGPLFKSTRIGEHRIPVNAVLYGGMHHTAELSCIVSPEHINPTINSARNIDIAFKIVVIAQVDNVKPYSLELPVTISNWQKVASSELTEKIGHVPNLSLGPPPQPKSSNRLAPTDKTRRYDQPPPQGHQPPPQGQQTQPLLSTRVNPPSTTLNGTTKANSPTEFGVTKGAKDSKSSTLPMMSSKQNIRDDTVIPSKSRKEEKVRPSTGTNTGSDSTGTANAQTEKLTVANDNTEGPNGHSWQTATEEKLRLRQKEEEKSRSTASAQVQQKWTSADEEKRKMFQQAQARVTKNQTQLKVESHPESAMPQSAPSNIQRNPQWPSAEDEKRRLFEEAKRRVASTQGIGELFPSSVQSPAHTRSLSVGSPNMSYTPSPNAPLTGAALYSSAMAAVNASRMANGQSSTIPVNASSSSSSSSPQTSTSADLVSRVKSANTSKKFPTAEEEKAALRYAEAKRAVEANQGPVSGSSSKHLVPEQGSVGEIQGDLIPYEQLFPERASSLSVSSSGYNSLRTSSATTLTRSSSSRDNELKAPPSSPSINATETHRRRPSLPSPPSTLGGFRPLSAVEEKARLRARYEAEEANAERISEIDELEVGSSQNGRSWHDYEAPSYMENLSSSQGDPTILSRDPTIKQGKQRALNSTTPPPLMPKPPSNYIKETQAEDERIRTQLDEPNSSSRLEERTERAKTPFEFSLDIRPFSPFEAGFASYSLQEPDSVPVPPIPPKIPISH